MAPADQAFPFRGFEVCICPGDYLEERLSLLPCNVAVDIDGRDKECRKGTVGPAIFRKVIKVDHRVGRKQQALFPGKKVYLPVLVPPKSFQYRKLDAADWNSTKYRERPDCLPRPLVKKADLDGRVTF